MSNVDPSQSHHDARMQRWREARFGLFIHWGLYSIPAGEWDGRTDHAEWIMETAKIPTSVYEGFVRQFNPKHFDARQWARLARNAGMKYLVATSKHHDGFALFDSKVSDYDVMATPFKRDVIGELAEACRAEGLMFCTYYSIMDWHHPDYVPRRAWHDAARGREPDFDRYVQYMKAQLRELLTNYGKIDVMWFDGEWEDSWTHERGVDLYHFIRSLQPDIIINNRVDKGRAGMKGMTEGDHLGDFGTPEQEVPGAGFPDRDWESCMTMNDNWGYNRADENWKSTRTLLHHLIDTASKGGNYLLNVGPTADGVCPSPCVERLEEIGRWMQVSGESVYGTSASPFGSFAWGRCTRKGSRLYLHVFDAPEDERLVVPVTVPGSRAYLLARPQAALACTPTRAGLEVRLPDGPLDPISTVVVMEVDV